MSLPAGREERQCMRFGHTCAARVSLRTRTRVFGPKGRQELGCCRSYSACTCRQGFLTKPSLGGDVLVGGIDQVLSGGYDEPRRGN